MSVLMSRSFAVALSLGLLLSVSLPILVEAAPRTYRVSASMARELRSVDQLMQTGRFEDAERRYMALLQKNPNNVPIRSALALAQAELFKLDAAERNAKMALSKDNKNAMAHMALGVISRNRTASQDLSYRSLRDAFLDQSATELEMAIRLDTRSPEAHNQLGTTYRFQGRSDEALREFERALTLDPAYAEAMVNKGIILQEKGALDEARKAYSKAIRLNSKNYMAHYRMGELFLKQLDPHQAIRNLNTALSLNRNNAAVLAKLGEAYEMQGNLSAAVANYRQAIHANPSYMPAYVGLSNLYDNRGDGELAMAELKSALNANPKYNPARNQLGRLALQVDKPDQALQFYKEALQVNPNDAEAVQGLSHALTVVAHKSASASETLGQESDLVNAELTIQEALRLNPNDLRLHLASMRISQLAGKPAASEAELTRIISAPPQNDAERMVQGEALLSLGRYDESSRMFRELMKNADKDPAKLLVIGDTLKANGDLTLAKEAYRAAKRLEPENLKAERAIQRIEKSEVEAEKTLRLAKALNNRRQRESSIDFYEEALAQNPRQPEARLALSKLYEKYKRYDKAIVSYQHYLGLMPAMSESERQHFERKISRLQALHQRNGLSPKPTAQATP